MDQRSGVWAATVFCRKLSSSSSCSPAHCSGTGISDSTHARFVFVFLSCTTASHCDKKESDRTFTTAHTAAQVEATVSAALSVLCRAQRNGGATPLLFKKLSGGRRMGGKGRFSKKSCSVL